MTDELVPSISPLITDNDIDVQSAAIRLVTELHMPAFKENIASALSSANDSLLLTQLCEALGEFDKSQTLLILASRLGEAKPVSGVVTELLCRAI